MIDDLRALAIFAIVAKSGSFSAAGRELRLATSGISQHILKLEKRLGTALFYRSTRALSLTTEGEELLKYASAMLEAAEDGLNNLNGLNGTADTTSGNLKVSLPECLSGSPYEAALFDFSKKFPSVSLYIEYHRFPPALIEKGIDLSLQIGSLRDSALVSRRLGHLNMVLVGAPSYLETKPKITRPEDLANVDFVAIEYQDNKLELLGKEGVVRTATRGHLSLASSMSALEAVRAGLGVQKFPRFMVEPYLSQGRLVPILPSWKVNDAPVSAVWPAQGRSKPLTLLTIKHITTFLSTVPQDPPKDTARRAKRTAASHSDVS